MAAFLDAVNVASVAIILAVCVAMGRESINDWRTVLIAIAGLVCAVFFKNMNTAFIVLGGSVAGCLLYLI